MAGVVVPALHRLILMKTPNIGDIVECLFLDHVEDGTEPLAFAVYGVLTRSEDAYVVIASWYGQDADSRSESENQKFWCIIRGAIQNMRVLK